MKNYILTNDDIQFMAEQIIRLHEGATPFNCETIAQEIMASLLVCSIKNGG